MARVLVISPHKDDETLGMGGTIARLVKEGFEVTVAVMTGYGNSRHPFLSKARSRTIETELKNAMGVLGVDRLITRDIPAVLVNEVPLWELNRLTNDLIVEQQPEILFVPFLYDLHRDHRELFHSFSITWRTATKTGRNIREIYTYEVMSETHLNFAYLEPAFTPNVWFDISATLETKLDALRCYNTQMREFPNLRSVETIEALARFRGSQMGVEAAEGFVLVRELR